MAWTGSGSETQPDRQNGFHRPSTLSQAAAMATALSGRVALAPFSRSETGVEACTTSTLFRSVRFEIT